MCFYYTNVLNKSEVCKLFANQLLLMNIAKIKANKVGERCTIPKTKTTGAI